MTLIAVKHFVPLHSLVEEHVLTPSPPRRRQTPLSSIGRGVVWAAKTKTWGGIEGRIRGTERSLVSPIAALSPPPQRKKRASEECCKWCCFGTQDASTGCVLDRIALAIQDNLKGNTFSHGGIGPYRTACCQSQFLKSHRTRTTP